MIENIKATTTVTRSGKGLPTLRATIPQIVVKLFNIIEGDTVVWTIDKDKRIIVKVEKGGS